MKASQLQTQIALNSEVLTGLYQEYSQLRASRKHYNEQGDACKDTDEERAEMLFGQANIYTPYIRKFAKRIKAIEGVQKSFKATLKTFQMLESIEDTYPDSWTMTNGALIQFADNTDGVAWQGTGEEFLTKLEEV